MPPGVDVPRAAATLLLIRDDPFEVLMVLRNARGSFASALVFPGGGVDEGDRDERWMPLLTGADGLDTEERAHRIAAVRETWEETGILVAGGAIPGDVASDQTGDVDFRSVVEARGITIALDDVLPFGHWITPEVEPRRFDARFYLARAPAGSEPAADGSEIVSVRWVAPAAAPGLTGSTRLPLPTLMNLARLAESSTVTEAMVAAAVRKVVTVAPVVRIDDNGETVITIPASAGYGITEFRR